MGKFFSCTMSCRKFIVPTSIVAEEEYNHGLRASFEINIPNISIMFVAGVL